MGCSAMTADEPSIRVIPVEFQTVNSYLDQYPRVVIQKLKQKFDTYSNERKQLVLQQFCMLYSSSAYKNGGSNGIEGQGYKFLHRLYLYFNDLQATDIKFRQFVIKYAILNKCQNQTLSNIIYFLHLTSSVLEDPMKSENYKQFIKNQRQYFGFQPSVVAGGVITKKQFYTKLSESGFLWQDYRKRFSLIDKQDMPFQSISRQFLDTQIQDYEIGQSYYVISSSWYERWSFYYQGKDHNIDQQDLKSTKMIKKKSSLNRQMSNDLFRKKSRPSIHKSHMDDPQNIWLIQQPTAIQFDDIQGQFEGQLKENLRVNYQCRFISENVWNMLNTVHPSKQCFKRISNSPTTLELYPKTIYYLTTNKKGQILDNSFEIIHAPLKTKLQKLSKIKDAESYFFVKEFQEKLWSQQSKKRMLAQISAKPRYFVVETITKIKFQEKYSRKSLELQNLTYGDRVYSYFPFVKKIMEAYILRFPSEKMVKVHYLNYNFRYEGEVERQNISIKQQTFMTGSIILTLESETHLFKGLANLGNTCFMNTIIQSLIATPVLDKYLQVTEFQENQHLLSAISKIGIKLLSNQKTSANSLKKAIDVHLEVFSGYDQHDAQEFLNLLLDKIHQEIKEKPTIIDQLFGGHVQSTLVCCSCNKKRQIEEKLSILSLPIPQAEFNTFVIFVFPIYEKRIRKVIMRFHRLATIKEYLDTFQDRMNKFANEFIFCEVFGGSIKKIRNDLFAESEKQKTIVDKGIPTNVEMYAFEKLRKSFYLEMEDQNKKAHSRSNYVDYYDQKQKTWSFGKLMKKNTFIQKYSQDHGFTTLKLGKNEQQNMKPLGHMVRQIGFKKFFLRKFNSALRRMQTFGYELMIGLPKYASYSNVEYAINTYLQNYVDSDISLKRSREKKPYFIKILDILKSKCIFCGMLDSKINSPEEVEPCCKVITEADIPLVWAAKQKSYQIYVEWKDLKRYNAQILSVIEVDTLSLAADKQKDNDKIHIDECFELLQKPQKVEMQCTKCNHPEHWRNQIIKTVPNILVLHMKEFKITAQKALIKLDVNLKWIQYLDISKYSLSQKGSLYELFAYVSHIGSNQSGHYTCVTKRKHPFENKKVWVNFDDDKTEILTKQQKNIDSAYLLFFKKVDMPVSTEINFIDMNGSV